MTEVKVENYAAPAGLNQFQTLALGVGVIGIAALVIGAFIIEGGVETALRAYLLGYTYWAGIAVGCLGILLLQHLTGGSWGLVIRRVLEAGAKTIPFVGLLFLPILIGATQTYEWAHYQAGHTVADRVLDWKAPYLNVPFFAVRALIYFAVWSITAYLLSGWSKQQDESGDWQISNKMNRFSAPGLIAFVLTVTFAAIDWVMSLDPHWYSTMFGLLFVIGWALSCMAFVIALMAWMAGREPMNHVLGSAHFHDLGKLMLAMVMIWAYFNFSQFLIIWAGNLPEETPWYLNRMAGGWGVVGLVLILFHFAFPFLLLLSQDLKKRYRYLAMLAVFILVMRLVDLFYLIAPNPTIHGPHENGLIQVSAVLWGIVATLGVGGIWLTIFFWFYKQRPILPFNDPFIENAIAHGREHH